VEIPTKETTISPVDDVSFHINTGEILGVVGESGAGKSITGTAILGLLEPPGRVSNGEIIFDGKRIDNLPSEQMRLLRGAKIGSVFQDPLTSLNPLRTIGQQLTDTIKTHLPFTQNQAISHALDLLKEVGIPGAEDRISFYPHQLSGGMRQRVVIALAICAEPKLIIADEPTTALDVSVQAQITMLLRRLCDDRDAAIMLITHDMGVIAETADRVAVMYAGQLVEIGNVGDVLHGPRSPYTRGLMNAIPTIVSDTVELSQIPGAMPRPEEIPKGCPFHPRCISAIAKCKTHRPELVGDEHAKVACWLYEGENVNRIVHAEETARQRAVGRAETPELVESHAPFIKVAGLEKHFSVPTSFLSRLLRKSNRTVVRAVNGLDFVIASGKTMGLVGESGCGKSTAARVISGLYEPTKGNISFHHSSKSDGKNQNQSSQTHTDMQMIFQDPMASLNPRWRVTDIVAEFIPDRISKIERVGELLELVGLSPSDGAKYPHEFSGGQRQRISIARALGANPKFLICDEPTSALDVSVQAQILKLMVEIQRKIGLTYLFISHDLAVVRHVSNDVGVMYMGNLVEYGPTNEVFSSPQHPYTQLLLNAVPDITKIGISRHPIVGEIPNPLDPPKGCSFHPRCILATSQCKKEVPKAIVHLGVTIACHVVNQSRVEV